MPLTTPSSLKISPVWAPSDPDAAAYIAAVEAADTAAGSPGGLEELTKVAIDNFVRGCKEDGIWTAIKASCILAGARTLAGALVPLVGPAPANVGPFTSSEYNRRTGIQGGSSGKYISTQVDNSSPLYGTQNSKHVAIYSPLTSANFSRTYIAGGNTRITVAISLQTFLGMAVNSAGINIADTHQLNSTDFPFMGISRSNNLDFIYRARGTNGIATRSSTSPTSGTFALFWDGATAYTNCRISFYSIGESLHLTLLDARVTDLMNALSAAIPP